jgi:hypothetical protein
MPSSMTVNSGEAAKVAIWTCERATHPVVRRTDRTPNDSCREHSRKMDTSSTFQPFADSNCRNKVIFFEWVEKVCGVSMELQPLL